MNRGNVYRLGTPHLVVETDTKPTETLYLRGFEGAEYIGGGWSESGDGTLFEDIEKELGWQMYADGLFQVSNLYHSMYFMMNSNMDTEGVPDWRNMRISHVNGEYTNMYVPYYSQRGWGWGGTFQEGYMSSCISTGALLALFAGIVLRGRIHKYQFISWGGLLMSAMLLMKGIPVPFKIFLVLCFVMGIGMGVMDSFQTAFLADLIPDNTAKGMGMTAWNLWCGWFCFAVGFAQSAG